jgi:putative MATE family efflux protein
MIKDRSFYFTLASIAIPLALQNLITFGIGLADNVMVGSLGDIALSGVFVSNQVQLLLHQLNIGISGSMVVLASQYLGKGDTDKAKIVIGIAFKFVFVLGLFFMFIVIAFPRGVLGLYTGDQRIINEGMKYIGIVCFSYIPFTVNNVLLGSMRCNQNTRIGFLSSLTGFCVNIFLNWILIFGHLGMPALGVRGAALATLIARCCELLVSFMYVRFMDKSLEFRLKDLKLKSPGLIADFFKYGVPIVLANIFWGLAGNIQVAILGRLSSEVLAANTIAANLHQIFGVVIYGISNASGIIIGRKIGAGDTEGVKTYARTMQIIFVSFGLITGLAIFLLRGLILGLGFPNITAEAHRYALQFLLVFSVSIVGTSYQMSVLSGLVVAGGATSFVLINDLIHVCLIVIPSALLAAFVFHFPPVVVFACLKSDQVLKCAVAAIKLHRWDWMKKLTR